MELHLRRIREACGLTLEQASPAIARSISTLSLLERGEQDVTVKTVEILARFYNVHPLDLMSFPDFAAACPCQSTRTQEDMP